jgi:glycolate oxidase FAD binding subunit
MVATADSGFLRQRYGGVRDQLIGISFVRSDGVFAKAGGRVVKNVAGYDMMKLFTGSYGTLGILTQVTFRAYPIPPAATTVVIRGDAQKIAEAGKMLLASTLTPTALEYVSANLMRQLDMGNEMGLWVRFQSTPESVEQQAKNTVKTLENLSINAQIYGDTNESDLWKRLSNFIEVPSPELEILGKIGVKPISAVACLEQLPEGAIACMRSRSGLGRIRFPYQDRQVTSDEIERLRAFCETERGFLTVLEAPPELKNQIDVWGYSGNAFSWMEKIKNQFDDRKILNPYRFVGGI